MRIPFLSKKTPGAQPERARPGAMGDDPTEIQAARTQARRRLVGAVVLLSIGVLGFPVLFETQPRPLPMDTPIEAPRRDTVASGLTGQDAAASKPQPLPVLPADAGAEEAPASAPAASAPPATRVAAAPAVLQAPALLASSPALPSPASAPATAKLAPASAPASGPARVPALLPAVAPAALPAAPVAAASAPPTEGQRYVVQAGAYSEAGKLREARAKIEKLGLKTYTQVVESDKGSRTRVRVGPYATQPEAEAVAAKIKRSGLPAAILAL
jgi:DedD protein